MRSLSIILLLFLFGCGTGSSDTPTTTTAPTKHVPILSNLGYSSDTYFVGQGSGLVNAFAHFDFSDSNGDLSSITVDVKDSSGSLLYTSTTPISPDMSGLHNGMISSVPIVISTTISHTISFYIYVTDHADLRSNTLTGNVSVISY